MPANSFTILLAISGIIILLLILLLFRILNSIQDIRKKLNQELQKNIETANNITEKIINQLEKDIREELRNGRVETNKSSSEARIELTNNLKTHNENLSSRLERMAKSQQDQTDKVTKQLHEHTLSNQSSLERVRTVIDSRVKELQEGNEKKLSEMRQTVDEKLQTTLEKRIGESFELVSKRLEAVQLGLGEMQNLASGVGDLKRVLSNVKTRGTWGEVQLEAILQDNLAPGQYEKNVRVKPHSSELVEFAIKVPSDNNGKASSQWLPVDSKFPQEDFQRLVEAEESADSESVKKSRKSLARAVQTSAKDIHDKYIDPPNTTDFGIMFLPTEGLYAEVSRQQELVSWLHKQRVFPAGPTNLLAILSSLRLGFQTVAITERAQEIRGVLGAVKTEFIRFGDVLGKVGRQLNTATKTIEDTKKRTNKMQKHLEDVERIPEKQAATVFQLTASEEYTEGDLIE